MSHGLPERFDTYRGLDDGPVMRERLLEIAGAAHDKLPDHCGLIMIVVPFGDGVGTAKAAYFSTCNRADSVAGMRAMADAIDSPRGAEEYFADRDAFVAYVCDEVNPARLKEGLECVSAGAASHLFDVITNRRYRR